MNKQTNGGWIEEVPAVDIELLENGIVRVTDKSDFQDDHSVDLHPIHLRLIAERMGLAASVTDSEAQALLMVDKLARRMRVLHERIKKVHEWMWENADRGFDECDINIEAWFIDATLDLSKEFMAEIEESRAVVTPRRGDAGKPTGLYATNPTGNPAETHSVSGMSKTPGNGTLRTVPKKGALSKPKSGTLSAAAAPLFPEDGGAES